MLKLSNEEYQQMFGRKKAREPDKEPRRSKYGNKKCEWMGFEFDSKRERDRFIILDSEQRAGNIRSLQRQVKFQLIPQQFINGKLVERECTYTADFVYRDPMGNMIVEDSKGLRTKEYIIKRKMMLWLYGIEVMEV